MLCPICSRKIKHPIGWSATSRNKVKRFSYSEMWEMLLVFLIVDGFTLEFLQEEILSYATIGDARILGDIQTLKLTTYALEECRATAAWPT